MASGGCLCGAVRYSAEDLAAGFHACHCGMCRRWAGGPLLAVRAGRVRFAGEEHLARYRSSDWAERGFCKVCGASLFYLLLPAQQYFIAMGTLDDGTDLPFAEEIYIDHKPAAYAFAGERPRATEAEVLARFGSSA